MTFTKKKTKVIINGWMVLSNKKKVHFPNYLFPYMMNDFMNHYMKIVTASFISRKN